MIKIDIRSKPGGKLDVRALALSGATEVIAAEFCYIFWSFYNASFAENPEAAESLKWAIQAAACDHSPAWERDDLPEGSVWYAYSKPIKEEQT